MTFAREGYVTAKDTWKLDAIQERMQKVDIPDVVLVSQAQAQHAEQLKEADAGAKKASEKIRAGDFDGAAALLQTVLAKDPTDANALFYLGLARVGKQQYREATESLARVTELQPAFSGSRLTRTSSTWRRGATSTKASWPARPSTSRRREPRPQTPRGSRSSTR